ncbi:hypothetical protein BDW75DRAFT_241166 [Aspergillus navahoensis]
MPSRKRLVASPIAPRARKIHRNNSIATDVDGNGSDVEVFDDRDKDDDYRPDAEDDESKTTTLLSQRRMLAKKVTEEEPPLFLTKSYAHLMELSHEKEYRRALKDWESFTETLMPRIIAYNATIPELPVKDIIFRLYRDVRFSRDQRPYKSHFSAAFSRTSKRRPYACYYLHLDQGSSYVGGGLWAPEPPIIQLLCQSIDERPDDWRQVLSSEPFVSMFLPTAKGGMEAALKAFADSNQEGALKTKPKVRGPDLETMQLHIDRIRAMMQTIETSSY